MKNNHTYIIGEIGQNHNGSSDIAKLIIDMVCRPVVDKLFGENLPIIDAIKLTKRDLTEELSDEQMNRPYTSIHSFGKTYGEHRAFLELSNEQHYEIYRYVKNKKLDFIETLCSPKCLSLLKLFYPDKLKVASRDLTNLPLLAALAETRIPIILSTGMAGIKELDDALKVITKYHEQISILHCVSEYPTRYQHVNLNSILYLKENYSKYNIGYSDHTIGIATPVAAVAMGAEIIEKHITIDRQMKGTDQAGSLEYDGVMRMVRDIRNLEMSMGEKRIFVEESVSNSRKKLERSIASLLPIQKGEIITENKIHLLSPGDGIKWIDKEKILGKRAKKDIQKNTIIHFDDVE